MAGELTVQDIIETPFVMLYFAPLGRESAHALAVQGVIQVDPRSQVPAAKNLLHELIHVKKPLWSETRVKREESRLWKQATWREKAALFQLLGLGTIYNGEDTQEKEDGGRS